jgi:hypothetical protein
MNSLTPRPWQKQITRAAAVDLAETPQPAHPNFDRAAVENHVKIVHTLATAANVGGILVLVSIEHSTVKKESTVIAERFAIGDVESMVDAIMGRAGRRNVNLYIPWAIFRKDLERGRKGFEKDVVAVLAFVADLDTDTGKAGGPLPLEPPYVVETSAGNSQPVFPLATPLSPQEAKPIAIALADAIGCDARTKDVSGIWRIPGTLNWPTKKKLERGRPPNPQSVKVTHHWTGELIEAANLRSALASHIRPTIAATAPSIDTGTRSASVLFDSLPAGLKKQIASAPFAGEDTSKTAASVISALRARGCSDDEIAAIFEDHPAGIGKRYAEGKDLRGELRRTREKWEEFSFTQADATAAPGWPAPQPIKSTLPPVEPFIPELLPDGIRDYVMDVADRQQAPADFAAVTALCGIAAVVGNRVRIRPKQNDDWEVVPNLWGAIVGRPSAMKSPAMQAALGPIYAITDDLREKWEEEIKSAEIDDALSGLDAKDAKKKAEKALKGGDRAGARDILAALVDGDDAEPPCPRIVVNDITMEKLGELLNENPRGLLLVRDELPGFLARMEREEFQSERAFYLEAFNGDGQFTYDRIGRGTVHIENCTLSIIGGVQPSRIAPIVRGAMTGASNDGLVQRLQLAVWPDDLGSWKWVDRKPDMLARLTYEKVFRDLYDVPMGDTDKPAVLQFSTESQELFRQWMTEIQTEARSGSLSSTMESHILKMPKTVASLALLFELIDGGRSEVNETAMRRALGWADYLRSHANRLYASGQTVAEDGARLIIERRRQLPEYFTARDVYKKDWAGLGDRDIVAAAIEMLISTNHCREVVGRPVPVGGRPTTAYCWNPALQGGPNG